MMKAYHVVFANHASVYVVARSEDESVAVARAAQHLSATLPVLHVTDVTARLSQPTSTNSYESARSFQLALRSGRTGYLQEQGGGRKRISHYKPKDWINVKMGRPMPDEPKTWRLTAIHVRSSAQEITPEA